MLPAVEVIVLEDVKLLIFVVDVVVVVVGVLKLKEVLLGILEVGSDIPPNGN